jgi:hypothetical protein
MASDKNEEKITWANMPIDQKFKLEKVYLFPVVGFLYSAILLTLEYFNASILGAWLNFTQPVTDLFMAPAQFRSGFVGVTRLFENVTAFSFLLSFSFILVYFRNANSYHRNKLEIIFERNYKIKLSLIVITAFLTTFITIIFYIYAYFSHCVLVETGPWAHCDTPLGPFLLVILFLLFSLTFLYTLSICIQFVRVRGALMFGRGKDE